MNITKIIEKHVTIIPGKLRVLIQVIDDPKSIFYSCRQFWFKGKNKLLSADTLLFPKEPGNISVEAMRKEVKTKLR